ncbi:MAG: DUF1080 domain-containing protein [Phycisphaerales bacterium]|nr:MAG: DUF1080 domain-containing protein [Phycisphaerales bacterium]
MKTARVIMVASLFVFAALSPAAAQQHHILGTRLFQLGDRLDYDLAITTAVQGIEQADCIGTASWRAEALEEIAGYNTVDVNQLFTLTSCAPQAPLYSYLVGSNQFFDPNGLLEVRRETDSEILTVTDDDPWELLQAYVDESDHQRYFGYGAYQAAGKMPPYDQWTGYMKSYVTFLGHEQITVPAGTFDCIAVLVKITRHDPISSGVNSGGYTEQTIWFSNIGLPVKLHIYQWIWDAAKQEKTEITSTMELTYTNVGPSIATDTLQINADDSSDQTFTVWNQGMRTLDYNISVTEGAEYFSVNPAHGDSCGPADPKTHRLHFNRTDVPPGCTVSGRLLVESVGADNSPVEISLSGRPLMASEVHTIEVRQGLNCSTINVPGDFNADHLVDFADFADLAGQWRQPPGIPSVDIAPDAPDGTVDMRDLAVFTDYWLGDHALRYEFFLGLKTCEPVELVEFLTPSGRTFEISKEPYAWSGNVETRRYFVPPQPWGRGTYRWEYRATSTDRSALADYGQGSYAVTVTYEGGGQDQTTVWFGVPDTNEFIPEPVSLPSFTHPLQNATVQVSPEFTWPPCADPNTTSLLLTLTNEAAENDMSCRLEPNATTAQETMLMHGRWRGCLSFQNRYHYSNADHIDVNVGAYSTTDVAFDISPLLLHEDFNAADLSPWTVVDDGTVDAPSEWSAATGRMVQSSNIFGRKSLLRPGIPGTYAFFNDGNLWTNYRVTLTISSDDDDAIGVMFRYSDNSHYYQFRWDKERDYRQLSKVEPLAPFERVLAEDNVPYVTGQNYRLAISALGPAIEVSIDGEVIFSVMDRYFEPPFGSGTIALYSWGNMGSCFDDIVVEQLPPPSFSDTFDDGDLLGWTVVDEGSTEAPSSWSAAGGAMVQSSNIFGGDSISPDMPGTYAFYEDGFALADCRINLDMTSNDDDAIGVMFRYKDDRHYYRFSWDAQRRYRRIVKKEDATSTVLAEDDVPYIPGRAYHLEIIASGPVITIFVDDEVVFSITDYSVDMGTIALYSWGNTAACFDNVEVKGL